MEDNANYKKAVDILSTRSILKESFSVNEIELFVKQTNFQRYKKKLRLSVNMSQLSLSFV
jgi:hypothetical protein